MKIKSIILFFLCIVSVNAQQKKIRISDNLDLINISENVYIHISYYDLGKAKHFPANGLIYIHEDKAFIVDTPWTNYETRVLLNWLADSLGVEAEAVIITHWHIDCMGGLSEIKQSGITSYAYVLTCEIAKQKNLPIPEICFDKTMELCNGKIIGVFLGAGHTLDNIVVWLPDKKILFGGCMLKALTWNGLGYLVDSDVQEWPHTLKKVLEEYPDSKIVIPGHGDYGNVDIVYHTLNLLNNKKQKRD